MSDKKMMEECKINYMNIEEFKDMGLLQEVNRLFFHPLGLALVISECTCSKKSDTVQWIVSGIWDYRDDPEGMLFKEIDQNKKAIANEFIKQQCERRKFTIGFVVQE